MACASLLTDENILRFRTKACLRLIQGSCNFGDDRCQYSHSQVWTRRSPYYTPPSARLERLEANHREPLLRYLPVLCENLLVHKGKVVKVTCPRGINCPFSHSSEEIAYHPLVYKTEPCKAFEQRACRVYYCWKSHGENERRQIAKNVFIGIVKGIDVSLNYPGANVVDLLPNKNGRRRRQRLFNSSVAPGLEGRSCNGLSLKCTSEDQTSLTLHRLLRHLADQPACDSSLGLAALQGYANGVSSWPPLTSLLHLLINQKGHKSCDIESGMACGSVLFGREERSKPENEFHQTCKRETNCPTDHGILLHDLLENVLLSRPADFSGSEGPLGGAHVQINEQVDCAGSTGRCLRPTGTVPSDAFGHFREQQDMAATPYLQQCRGPSFLKPVEGFDDRLNEDAGQQPGEPLGERDYKLFQRSGEILNGSGDALPLEETEVHDCSLALWSPFSSVKGSISGTGASQASSANLPLSVCEQAQINLDALRACIAEPDDFLRGGQASYEAGSRSSTCLPLELSGYSVPYYNREESPVSQRKNDRNANDQWKRSCWLDDNSLRTHQGMEKDDPTPCSLMEGLYKDDLTKESEAANETEDDTQLRSCLDSLLKMIQEK